MASALKAPTSQLHAFNQYSKNDIIHAILIICAKECVDKLGSYLRRQSFINSMQKNDNTYNKPSYHDYSTDTLQLIEDTQ